MVFVNYMQKVSLFTIQHDVFDFRKLIRISTKITGEIHITLKNHIGAVGQATKHVRKGKNYARWVLRLSHAYCNFTSDWWRNPLDACD